jgi:hypothetical protein
MPYMSLCDETTGSCCVVTWVKKLRGYLQSSSCLLSLAHRAQALHVNGGNYDHRVKGIKGFVERKVSVKFYS